MTVFKIVVIVTYHSKRNLLILEAHTARPGEERNTLNCVGKTYVISWHGIPRIAW